MGKGGAGFSVKGTRGDDPNLTLPGGALITRFLTARIALARQEHAQAIAELQRVVNDSPTYAPARLLLGAALLAQGNLNQAEAQLAELLQRSPQHAEARKLLAQIRLRLQRPDAALQALTEFGEGAESDPQVQALLDLAKLQRAASSGGAASDDRERRLALAMASLRAGDPVAAIDGLSTVPRLRGDVRRETLELAALRVTRGAAVAQSQLEEWLKADPKDVPLLNLAATFHAGQREFDRAREYQRQALVIQADDPASLLNAARIEGAAGQLSAARAYLEQTLEKEPGNAQARLGLVQLSLRGNELGAAERELISMTQRDAKAVEPRLLLARVQLQSKKRQEADRTLEDAVVASGRSPGVLNAVGLMYLEMGRYDEAILRFRQTIAADEREPGYRLNLARAQLALDQKAAARVTLEETLQQFPNRADAVGALMVIDLLERKPDAAVERLKQRKAANERDPGVAVLEGECRFTHGQGSVLVLSEPVTFNVDCG